MKTAQAAYGKTARRAAPERGPFEGGPPLGLQVRLGLAGPGRPNVGLWALLAILIGWAPLAVLTSVQGAVLQAGGLQAFLSDAGVHARFLVAAPLFIVAEAVCTPALGAIARHFSDAGLVAEHDRPRLDAAIASTRASLDSALAEIGVVALAYAATVALIFAVSPDQLPAWHRSGGGAASFSPAGWWHALVSLPLLLALMLGWMWRLCLWTRFLWRMSRLDLRLVPVHPDRSAGLLFVGQSVRAFSILALALGTILAGSVTNSILQHPASVLGHKYLIGTAAIVVVALFTGPLLVFGGMLRREWRRGVLEYGELADHVGHEFERKWLCRGRRVNEGALEAPDFSATTDLYQTVSNLYAMRFVPIDLRSVVILICALLLPLVPVALMTVPGDEILAAFRKLLF